VRMFPSTRRKWTITAFSGSWSGKPPGLTPCASTPGSSSGVLVYLHAAKLLKYPLDDCF
jgi:hypothetical protein